MQLRNSEIDILYVLLLPSFTFRLASFEQHGLFTFIDIKECDRKEEHGCFGDCEELPGTFHCHCLRGTDGNPRVRNGCIKPALNTGTIEHHRYMSNIFFISILSASNGRTNVNYS